MVLKAVLSTLLIMMLGLTILGIAHSAGVVTLGDDPVARGWNGSGSMGSQYDSDMTLDGNSSTISTEDATSQINLLLSGGVFGALTASVALVCIVGFSVLGSGFSTVTVKTIMVVAFYMLLWTVCSFGAVSLLGEIPLFGITLYFLMTLVYSIGVIGEVY